MRHLVDRARHPRARADALFELRKRLDTLPKPSEVAPELLAMARRMAELRERLTVAIGDVQSCSTCALKHPEPFGHWAGGHCCGGDPAKIFEEDELAALKLSGTTAADFQPPNSDLAGCVFRGPNACSLKRQHRPTLCVHYTCRSLEHEVRERGDLKKIRVIQKELSETFANFSALRSSLDAEARYAEELGWPPDP